MWSSIRFCLSVYFDLSPRAIDALLMMTWPTAAISGPPRLAQRPPARFFITYSRYYVAGRKWRGPRASRARRCDATATLNRRELAAHRPHCDMNRNAQTKGRPATNFALDVQIAAERLGDAFTDREAQAG